MPITVLLVLSSVALGTSCAQTPPTPPKNADAIAALERKVLCHPRKYAAGVVEKFTSQGGQRVDYQTIPVAISRTLAEEFKGTVTLQPPAR